MNMCYNVVSSKHQDEGELKNKTGFINNPNILNEHAEQKCKTHNEN